MAILLEILPALQAGLTPDTVVALMVPPEPSAFDYASGVLQILVLIVGFFALGAMALLAITLRKSVVALQSTVDRLTTDIRPLLMQATRLTEDAHDIVKTVRREVDRLSDATGQVSERLLDVSDLAAQRIDDVNALLTVLQDQVQDTALSAVAAVRGLRVSAAGIGDALTGNAPRSVSRRIAMRAARIKAREEDQPLFDDEDEEVVSDEADLEYDVEIEDHLDDDDIDDDDDDIDDDIDDDDDGEAERDVDDAADIDTDADVDERPYYATDDAAPPQPRTRSTSKRRNQ